MLKEFKAFAMKGNLVDIAVAFVMGAAFKGVVTSFTSGIVSPLIGLIYKSDFKDLKFIIKQGVPGDQGSAEGELAIKWGEFLTYTIDFIIVAFIMFLIIKSINRLKAKEDELPSGPTDIQLLSEIRDLLKK